MKGTEQPIGHYGLSVVSFNTDGKVVRENRYGELGSVMTQVGAAGAKAKPRPIPEVRDWLDQLKREYPPAAPETILAKGDEDKNVEIAKSALTALENKKEEAFTAVLTDDIEQDGVFHLKTSKRKEGAKKFYKSFTTAFPDAKFEVTKAVAIGDYAIVESTLVGAVEDGALAIALPKFVKKELEGYLDCGLLCRGFARVQCASCSDKHLVAFGCGGRGFCPSCLGRKMAETALNLQECVLPPDPLRQWVLTFPFPFAWRSRLGFDAPLFGALTRLFVRTVLGFYTQRLKDAGVAGGQSGAVVALQRTSSDLRLNPHLNVVFLDGVYREEQGEVVFHALPRLSTREVGAVLEQAVRRMARYLARRGLLGGDGVDSRELDDGETEPTLAQGHAALCASAASGQSPPAGPELRRRTSLAPLVGKRLAFDKPLCASVDGFTLHAATRGGGLDARAREALLKYVLRPPIAQERITRDRTASCASR